MTFITSTRVLLCTLCVCFPSMSRAAEWFVAPGGAGNGSSAAPFGRIQQALSVAGPGDFITVRPGTYSERMFTVRAGAPSSPITIRAASGPGSVVVTLPGELLQVDHPYIVIDGLVLDGQYASAILVDINTSANYFVFRNSEVRRTSRDCIDMGSPVGVLFDGALIHHCLNSSGGRSDAHGIAAGAVRNLTLRNTEIHTFSGDALQLDPIRRAPGWDLVTIEGCRFWLAPLPVNTNGFRAGTVPGENAIDTKTYLAGPRGRISIRDTRAWGFRGGLIGNMAAFNLKEKVDALLDRVTVTQSDIGFRTRGPGGGAGGAWVRIQNGVVYDVARAIRYEDNIEQLLVFNTTIGHAVPTAFQAASSNSTGLDVRNVLILAGSLPPEASGPSNLAVGGGSFVSSATGDYHLVAGSVPIDQGDTIDDLPTDRDGVLRPQGGAYDVGAFEFTGGGGGSAEINVGDVAVTEPPATANAVFPIRLSSPSNQGVSVKWSTVARSAAAGADFMAAAGTLTFAPGQVLAEVRVPVLGDPLDEAKEYFDVVLSQPEGATIGRGTGRAQIADDDPLPVVSIDSAQTVQERSGAVTVSVQVTMSAPSGRTVKVDFATSNLTAIAGRDYRSAAGTLSFPAGTTTRTVTVTILADALVEAPEQFRITLSSPRHSTIGVGQSTVTITDRP